MRAELKRAADLVAFQRREALSRKRLSGDPRNPFRPPVWRGADLRRRVTGGRDPGLYSQIA